ncbi:hypothetical protein [Dongshaea marina]|uniref:hypothetical protein n=1 Tax=Dongshaea marina TaxID=2047966 RepID=UPI001F1FD021|nr:hypothetical protein [Dongshaea marina]
MVRSQGKEAFEALLNEAMPFGEFMFERLTQDQRLDGEAAQNAIANQAVTMIRQVPDGFNREGLITLLSRQLRWGENEKRLRQLISSAPASDSKSKSSANDLKLTPVRRAIAMILQHPELAAELPEMPELTELDLTGMPFLLELLAQIKGMESPTTGLLLELWRGKREEKALAQLATADIFQNLNVQLSGEIDVWQEMLDTFERFYVECLKQRLSELQKRGEQGKLTPNEAEELIILLKEL